MQNTPAWYNVDFENLKFFNLTTAPLTEPLLKKTERSRNKDEGPYYGGKPTRFWLDQFKDADSTLRSRAVVALGALAQKDKDLIPLLIGAVSENNNEVGRAAVSALGRAGPAAVPALLELLKNTKSPTTRIRVAVALGDIGSASKAAVPRFFCKPLKMDDWNVRLSAAFTPSVTLGRTLKQRSQP